MSWVRIQNPTQELLDELLKEAKSEAHRKCHDCGVSPGEAHLEGCDTARCLKCNGQYLSCDCEDGYGDVWDGMWPGTMYAYENRLVCYWDGDGIHPIKAMFDYNEVALRTINNGNN